MSEKIYNVAFIGNGKSTNRYHVPYLNTLKDQFNIKKIWKHSDKKSEWETIEGVEYTSDLDSILNDEDIDLVVVTTPAQTHYEYAKKALEAGKNVLVEKPFTMTSKEAIELYDLAEEKELVLDVYQNRRFDSDIKTVIKVLKDGKLGNVYEIESNYDFFRPEVPESSSEFKAEESLVYSHACHLVDQFIYYLGIPNDYYIHTKQILGTGKMNDYLDIDLFYKNTKELREFMGLHVSDNLSVFVRSSYFRLKSRPRFIITGTKGVFIKEGVDKQEEDLKRFYMPGQPNFGVDKPEDYGTLYYIDDDGETHIEKVVSEVGDYADIYRILYHELGGILVRIQPRDFMLAQLQILEEAMEELE